MTVLCSTFLIEGIQSNIPLLLDITKVILVFRIDRTGWVYFGLFQPVYPTVGASMRIRVAGSPFYTLGQTGVYVIKEWLFQGLLHVCGASTFKTGGQGGRGRDPGYRGLEKKDVASAMYLFIQARSVPSIPL